MFLKSLVLRGFKSFADKTTLVFEPGIAIVVGPNGSGKTNVVDSISWVLGEQGPRSLRGGKMQDVIFAGSQQRPALGMAEVTMTIDNSSGIIPIEFTEFTISRILFRSGESEYRLNGVPCRLLDIQEILSDTGIGREQHTIIGQGELDDILQADPMQMRNFVEEAAGVAKHRRRKERALRKIAASEQNMGRLSDLLSEIRRQLRPLREQAEVAKRHSTIASELGRVKLILAARELSLIRHRVGDSGTADLDGPLRQKEQQLTDLEDRLASAERSRNERFGESELARDTAWTLSRLGERFTGLARLAQERSKTLRAELAGASESVAQAHIAELAREQANVEQLLAQSREGEHRELTQLQQVGSEVQLAAAAEVQTERAVVAARAAHRESLSEAIRIQTEIGALAVSLESAEHEFTRVVARRRVLGTTREETASGLAEIRAELERLESDVAPLEETLTELDSEAGALDSQKRELEGRIRAAELEAAAWRGRAEVRFLGSPSAANRIAGMNGPGIVGILSDLVVAPRDLRAALDAVAGPADGVVVVTDAIAAEKVLRNLRPDETIGLLQIGDVRPVPQGCTALQESVEAADPRGADAIAGVFLAPSLADAARLAAENLGAVFVTREGGVAAGRLVASGAADATARAEDLGRELAETGAALEVLGRAIATNQERRRQAVDQVNQADAQALAAAERLGALDREAHASELQIQTVLESEQAAEITLRSQSERLDSLRASLPRLESGIEQAQVEIDRLQEVHAGDVEAHRRISATHEEARLAEARASERRKLLEEQQDSLNAALDQANAAASGIEDRRRSISHRIDEAESVAGLARDLGEASSRWAAEAEQRYQSIRAGVSEIDAAIAGIRTERAGLAGALDDMRVRAREQDAGRSEWLVRARMIEERMDQEWAITPEQAVARFGHLWEVEDESKITDPTERNALLDEEALRRKRTRLERDLEGMGQVNPFAAQEFESLTERETFLAEQIADVRRSRRDLFRIVGSIDEHMRQTFVDAFEDVSREFGRLLQMLFPGGQGRLRLTDPHDLLETGIEVEVRPGGKNLKRLSLLSGGEKALAALAVLFAIFRARPSPFYVLDEVEAALDDVNLHRFLSLLDDFRETAQLVVVTHQKRTMEVADVLYGISIRGDGASRVIAERMSRPERDVPQRLPSD